MCRHTPASQMCFFGGSPGDLFAGFEDVQEKMCLILVISNRGEVCWAQKFLVHRTQGNAGHGEGIWLLSHVLSMKCVEVGAIWVGCSVGVEVPPATSNGCFLIGWVPTKNLKLQRYKLSRSLVLGPSFMAILFLRSRIFSQLNTSKL